MTVFRDELTNLLYGDEDAKRLSQQSFILSEFLKDKVKDYEPPKLKRKAIVHGHCHHKSQLHFETEIDLLKKAGVECKVPDSGCCGMAGSFGYEADHYKVGLDCGERVLLPSVRSAPDDELIVTDGFSCREMIRQETDRHAVHFAQVLQMAIKEGPNGPSGTYAGETVHDTGPNASGSSRHRRGRGGPGRRPACSGVYVAEVTAGPNGNCMLRDKERIDRIQRVLSENNWDALVCALPSNVLLLSGYWPVIGSAVAIFTREGAVIVLAPEDERELAEQGWADEVRTFESGSLHNLKTISESVDECAERVEGSTRDCRLEPWLGMRDLPRLILRPTHQRSAMVPESKPCSRSAFPSVALVDATTCLARLRSVLTDRELSIIRRACEISREAFLALGRAYKRRHAGIRCRSPVEEQSGYGNARRG